MQQRRRALKIRCDATAIKIKYVEIDIGHKKIKKRMYNSGRAVRRVNVVFTIFLLLLGFSERVTWIRYLLVFPG